MTAILKTEWLCQITVFGGRELSGCYAVEREAVRAKPPPPHSWLRSVTGPSCAGLSGSGAQRRSSAHPVSWTHRVDGVFPVGRSAAVSAAGRALFSTHVR